MVVITSICLSVHLMQRKHINCRDQKSLISVVKYYIHTREFLPLTLAEERLIQIATWLKPPAPVNVISLQPCDKCGSGNQPCNWNHVEVRNWVRGSCRGRKMSGVQLGKLVPAASPSPAAIPLKMALGTWGCTLACHV